MAVVTSVLAPGEGVVDDGVVVDINVCTQPREEEDGVVSQAPEPPKWC